MRKKLSFVIVSFFLLLLTSCGLFEGPTQIKITAPQEGDIFVQGDSFWVFADINPNYYVGSVNVSLILLPEHRMYDSVFLRDSMYICTTLVYEDTLSYDSTLWECDFGAEGVSVEGNLSIAKQLMVPFDAPVYDDYTLNIDLYGGGGYADGIPVSVRSSDDE